MTNRIGFDRSTEIETKALGSAYLPLLREGEVLCLEEADEEVFAMQSWHHPLRVRSPAEAASMVDRFYMSHAGLRP